MKGKKIRIVILLSVLLILTAILFSNRGYDITTRVRITQGSESQKILAKNMKRHVRVLSDEIGNRSVEEYDSLIKAEEYIKTEFKNLDYNVETQEYEADGKKVRNIIAETLGGKTKSKPIIVGAHYDSYKNPGADDNASGVAGVIELARLLKSSSLENPIRFIAFVNEEPPYFKDQLMGSHVYAKSIRDSNSEIEVAIILEMIGLYSDEYFSQTYPIPLGLFYPNKGNFILAVGNKVSNDYVKNFTREFKSNCGMPIRSFSRDIQGIDFSDHWSFWENGYKAMMITNTAFYRNMNYHTKNDTFETLNYDYMSETVWGVYKAISHQ